MAWTSALVDREVSEVDAPARIKEIYADIKASLRVPAVDMAFRVLASQTDFLEVAWPQLQPNVRIAYFERCADEIRARAVDGVARLGAPPRPPDGADDALRDLHYADPKLLVVLAALRSSFAGSQPVLQILPAEQRRQIDTSPITWATSVTEAGDDAADPRVTEIFADIMTTLGVAFVSSDYRVLANWPDYLAWAWQSLKSVIFTPEYRALTRELRRMAEETLTALPFRMDLSPHTLRLAGLAESDLDVLRSMLDRFYGSMPGRVASMAFLSIGALGQYDASRSPYPVE